MMMQPRSGGVGFHLFICKYKKYESHESDLILIFFLVNSLTKTRMNAKRWICEYIYIYQDEAFRHNKNHYRSAVKGVAVNNCQIVCNMNFTENQNFSYAQSTYDALPWNNAFHAKDEKPLIKWEWDRRW